MKQTLFILTLMVLLPSPIFSQEDRDLDLDHKVSSDVDKKDIANEYEKVSEVSNNSGWATEDLSEINDDLNFTVFMEENVHEGNQTCDPSNTAVDFEVFRFFTEQSQKCSEVTYNIDEDAKNRIEKEYKKEIKEGLDEQNASRNMQERLEALASKTVKLNEKCARSYLQGQWLALRLNWLQNIDVLRWRKSCVEKWEKQISDRSGECKKELKSAYDKYNEALKINPENRPASQNTQILEYVKKLVTWDRGCSKTKLSLKNNACKRYAKSLGEAAVVCQFKDKSGTKKRNTFIDLLSDPRLDKTYIADAFSFAINNLISPTNAGEVWDEMRKDKRIIQTGVVENQNSTHGLLHGSFHRGALYVATIDDKAEALDAGHHDKISLENVARSGAVKNLSDNLGESTNSALNTSDSVLNDLLSVDPSNPSLLSSRNLDAADALSANLGCLYGKTSKGDCNNPSLNPNNRLPLERAKKILKADTNFQYVFHNLDELSRSMAKGRPFSKKAQLAHTKLKAFHKRRSTNKNKITKSKFKKMAKMAGVNLPNNDLETFKKLKLAFKKQAQGGNGFSPKLRLSDNTSEANGGTPSASNDTAQKDTTLGKTISQVGSGGKKLKKGSVKAERFNLNWSDPGGDYYEKTEAEVEELVRNGEMPTNAGIESDKNRNIFNIISRRYLISGYKKLQLMDIK